MKTERTLEEKRQLEGTAHAEKLADTIEKLEAVADLLADIDPPLGFGRD